MKNQSINIVKQAMLKVQEAIDLLDQINGENENIDEGKYSLGFAYADLEHEVNSI